MRSGLTVLFFWLTCVLCRAGDDAPRRVWSLQDDWRSVSDPTDSTRFAGFEQPGYEDGSWSKVSVPHNWDDYAGLRRMVHGNDHGFAWYRRSFAVPATEAGRRVLLFFEGVGSYATVWVNGKPAGSHAGGRTTFTLDVTDLVQIGEPNLLAVRADHPAGITDLPWVCGGCAATPGFSEGSQPMGIFRPVTLITTNSIRIEPFGIHVWNDADASAEQAVLHVNAEVRNEGRAGPVELSNVVLSPEGVELQRDSRTVELSAGVSKLASVLPLSSVRLWSPETPHLYVVKTSIHAEGRLVDEVETSFGVRTIHWPSPTAPLPAPFLLNGKPYFINGTCEYEHLLGASHAFSPELIRTRVAQIKAAGFNALRDAHQPHHLLYQELTDREGLLWWPQMAAQIWYDTPAFRANFKALLRDWVRERRNHPSAVLWGLANESKLPEDFARECAALIRELDPTASTQRLITTCNGGKGTDWNVPQNWTGTYGGNPEEYAEDLRRQRLIGEYGAWRSLGLHSEGGFIADGIRSESRHDALLAMKIRLAESVREEVPGHFHWLLATHDNPGRTIGSRGQQGSDGWAALDRIGPANNKGLLTLWGEPTDAFFMYRASYAPSSDPMVHIVSHTWPDRWDSAGRKDGIEVWSNCDEVELFNDCGAGSLGVRRRGGPGVPFRWDGVEIAWNVLYAEGRIAGKTVARDLVLLKNLPSAPGLARWVGPTQVTTKGEPGWHYLYRVNCGGPDLVDVHGQTWYADQELRAQGNWGAHSWAERYAGLDARFGSQRESFEAIRGTDTPELFRTYRYGRHALSYTFTVPPGDYRVELYFTEPWYGRGGGDVKGWRLFDVAINDETVLRDLDLWSEAGYAGAVRKVVQARAQEGKLVIHFPRVASYQAVLSAIAIASRDPVAATEVRQQKSVLVTPRTEAEIASEALMSGNRYLVEQAKRNGAALTWTVPLGLGGNHDFALTYTNSGSAMAAEFRINAQDGTVMDLRVLRFPSTEGGASQTVRISDVGMNAGEYTVTVMVPPSSSLRIESLLAN